MCNEECNGCGDCLDDDVMVDPLERFVESLASKQKDSPQEFSKIVDDNFWDLIEKP